MDTKQRFWQQFLEWWSLKRVALILLVTAFLLGAVGYLNQHSGLFVPLPIIADFYANVTSELTSIAVTVLVIDTLNERRSIQQEKVALILQMDSPTNSIAREAVRVLRARGWLMDGSLQEAFLYRANLQDSFLVNADLKNANLRRANLNRAYLQGANLTGAKDLEDKQLVQTKSLQGANMPDGSRYNGRYNLSRDLRWALKNGIDINEPAAMAEFYMVSLESYERGQSWARQNLSSLRSQAMATTEEEAVTRNQKAKSQTSQVISQKLSLDPINMLSALVIGVFLLNLWAKFFQQRN